MARVEYVTSDGASGDAQQVLKGIEDRGADVLNLFRTVANSPNALRNFMRLGNSLLRFGTLPPVLRETAILRVAQLTGAGYEWAHHVPIALQAGVTEEQMAALEGWQTSSLFDDDARATLRFVDAVTLEIAVADDVFDEVKRRLGEAAVVELALVAGYWGMVARVLVAAKVDVEPAYEKYLPPIR